MVVQMADDYVRGIEREKRQAFPVRRKTETTYQVRFEHAPLLIDEDLSYGAPRTPEELVWAEQRLAEIGFRAKSVVRVKSYVVERGEWVVYADPRAKGRIDFTAYRKPLPQIRRRPRNENIGTFQLQDSVERDIQSYYEKQLTEAIGR
jgi:hypothetical protein